MTDLFEELNSMTTKYVEDGKRRVQNYFDRSISKWTDELKNSASSGNTRSIIYFQDNGLNRQYLIKLLEDAFPSPFHIKIYNTHFEVSWKKP